MFSKYYGVGTLIFNHTFHIHSRIPEHINLNYAIRGKSVTSKIECKSEISDLIGKTMNMENMIKD